MHWYVGIALKLIQTVLLNLFIRLKKKKSKTLMKIVKME